MKQQIFPVHALNANITRILSRITTVNIHECISNGLSNEIFLIDENSRITCPAEIIYNKLEDKSIVKLSSAYCQYLWLTCDIALKSIDFNIILQECDKFGGNIEIFSNCIQQVLQMSKEEIQNLMKNNGHNINIDQYLDYLKRTPYLLDVEQLKNDLELDTNLLFDLTNNPTKIDINRFSQINVKGSYEEKVNGMYCYGVVFILLHELSHFLLGHIYKSEENGEETEADIAAFWEMYSSLEGQDRFTAICGILGVLFSLLYLNPNMTEDGIHPREDKRIFDIYENIKEENEKFAILIIHMFKLWKDFNSIQDFPELKNGNLEDAINSIKEFLSGYNPN